MKLTAVILTDNHLDDFECKTAHGLIEGPSRYRIVGIVDQSHQGSLHEIPFFANVTQAVEQLPVKPNYCVIGVAPVGGRLSDNLIQTILEAIALGIGVVSGLHSLLSDNPLIADLAKQRGVELIDLRRPKTAKELPMWSGRIATVTIPRIAMRCCAARKNQNPS